MKSFVRKMEESKRWFAAVIGTLVIALWLAAEATNGLAYLPFYAVFLIDLAIRGARWIRKRSKELPGGARSTGSR